MPILKSSAVHTSVNRCLRYVLNPDKCRMHLSGQPKSAHDARIQGCRERQEDLLYTSALNCLCDPDEAYLNMKMIYEHFSGKSYNEPLRYSGKSPVKAIHYIQSFSPDETITPEKAHTIAKAFVKKTFGDDVQVIIATHCDKAHVHSHIVINSYSVTGRKYYDNWTSREHAREYSDRVCQVFGIELLKRQKGGKGLKYNEWEHRRKGTSWKQQICAEIDSLIGVVADINELYAELEKKGYTIKHGNAPAIKAEGQQRFVRFKTLGEDYTEDRLRSRILWKDGLSNAEMNAAPDSQSPIQAVYVSTIERLHILITEGKKIPRPRNPDLPYLPNNDHDVYILSAQLSVISRNGISSIEELEHKIENLKEDYEGAIKQINPVTAEISRLEGVIEQSEKYFALSGKGELSSAEQVMLNLCRQTVNANGITNRADLDRLKKEKSELDSRLTELKHTFEVSKKQYEMYREIANTYHDICEGDYISRLIAAEKEKKEEDRQETKEEQQTVTQKKKGLRR